LKQYILSAFLSFFIFIIFEAVGHAGDDKGGKPTPGELVFKKYHCNACHGDKGVGVGDLRKAWQKYNDEQLRAYISNPPAFNNPKMPVFGPIIADQDWPLLLQYVRKLGKDAAQPVN
jgi:mono/diheme cytochrome c family protein